MSFAISVVLLCDFGKSWTSILTGQCIVTVLKSYVGKGMHRLLDWDEIFTCQAVVLTALMLLFVGLLLALDH